MDDSCLPYPLDWRILYPANCTRKHLEKILRDMERYWRGWDAFPWYLSRTLHHHIDGPPADWDTLHTFFWMQGHAAHVILNEKFQSRNAVLDMLIRHEVQFVGVFRHLVAEETRWCLIFTKQARLPDCALWGADTPENRAAVQQKRDEFREGIETAVSEFVRVLNFGSATKDVDLRIAGQPLRTWYKGGHLPDPVEVPVQMVEEDGRVHLAPDEKTWLRFLSRRLPVPMIEVCPDSGPLSAGDAAPPSAPGGEAGTDQAGGAPDAATKDEEETSRRIAFGAVELATKLDAGAKKNPTHAAVLGMYCAQNMSIRQIAKACGCGHATVVNRKRELEKKLGLPLDAFRRHSGMMEEATKAAEDGRAKKIYRRGLME